MRQSFETHNKAPDFGLCYYSSCSFSNPVVERITSYRCVHHSDVIFSVTFGRSWQPFNLLGLALGHPVQLDVDSCACAKLSKLWRKPTCICACPFLYPDGITICQSLSSIWIFTPKTTVTTIFRSLIAEDFRKALYPMWHTNFKIWTNLIWCNLFAQIRDH